MPSRADMDLDTRARIRAWLWHFKVRRRWTTTRLAKELRVAEPTATNVLNGRRSAGLDLVISMHRRLHISADDILDTTPSDSSVRVSEE